MEFGVVAGFAQAKEAPWGFAVALCNNLEALRAIVSSATNTPLPGLIPKTDVKELEIGDPQVPPMSHPSFLVLYSVIPSVHGPCFLTLTYSVRLH